MKKKERKGRSFDSFLTIFSSFLEGELLLKGRKKNQLKNKYGGGGKRKNKK